MSDFDTGQVDDGLLSYAKLRFPKYLIKIMEEFILNMKMADELLWTSAVMVTQNSYQIQFENFWKDDVYNLDTIVDRLSDAELEYFAESTFPSVFNMFSTEEYCRRAKEFIEREGSEKMLRGFVNVSLEVSARYRV